MPSFLWPSSLGPSRRHFVDRRSDGEARLGLGHIPWVALNWAELWHFWDWGFYFLFLFLLAHFLGGLGCPPASTLKCRREGAGMNRGEGEASEQESANAFRQMSQEASDAGTTANEATRFHAPGVLEDLRPSAGGLKGSPRSREVR